jgi:hypothetical protein
MAFGHPCKWSFASELSEGKPVMKGNYEMIVSMLNYHFTQLREGQVRQYSSSFVMHIILKM